MERENVMKKKLIKLGVLSLVVAGFVFSSTSAEARLKFQRGGFDNSIVDTAVAVNAANGEFSTLIAALQAAGLVEILDSVGDFTVFAPTDAAFAQLGLTADNVGTALPRRALTRILLNHVTFGSLESGDVLGTDRIKMLSWYNIYPRSTLSGVFVTDSAYTPARILIEEGLFDIVTDNGVIHVIDNVLLFPGAVGH